MSELLAPAGNFEALVAAISNGADAVYLGMNQFGARAYSANFNLAEIKEAISYAHLRNVKIYVTINTILFEEELPTVFQMIDQLAQLFIDGIIIQDLAVLEYVTKKYPLIEAHCSTQMGIDDIEGTLLLKELGAKRVVLAREVSIEKAKQIKKTAKIPIELFIHGALCVSYSGNCLMSGLIGYRSGNRGRCVGSCRKPYTLIDQTTNKSYPTCYLFSMKDLNTLSYIPQLKEIDSLKIEGRMKEPAYVANVVSLYRTALDGKTPSSSLLAKTFHRTFTKGYLFNEDKEQITNIDRPNNYGVYIGKITAKTNFGYQITLKEPLNQNDIIRIDHNHTDIILTTTKLYDAQKNLISCANHTCFIKIKEEASIGDCVYKTKDVLFYKELSKSYPKEFKRFPIKFLVSAFQNQPLTIHATCQEHQVSYESNYILEASKTIATDEKSVLQQLNRLNETVYVLDSLEFYTDNVYLPAKVLNEARREIISRLNEKRLKRTYKETPLSKHISLFYPSQPPVLAAYVTTKEQYEAAKDCGIPILYYEGNTIRRNETNYPSKDSYVLVGGYGGIYAYTKTNEVISDFSLNVVNSKSVYLLHSLGVKRVTLSYEMNKKQILTLIDSYQKENGGLPSLEMIVYGHTHLLQTKYCPLKKLHLCGTCKTHQYLIKDEYEAFPLLFSKDCLTTILNGKTLNLIDELDQLQNINVFRLQFTIESKEETKKIIELYQKKLVQKQKTSYFNSKTDTRGHFNKEIL